VQYLMLIYGDENAKTNAPKEALDAMMRDYAAYTQEMQEAGVRLGGEILHPTSSATTVRVQDGKPVVTHGPFAETTEQLGGYYVLNCNNLDEATEWAAKCPGARFGSIEVRPIVDFRRGQ
jgi:hypothetical protein